MHMYRTISFPRFSIPNPNVLPYVISPLLNFLNPTFSFVLPFLHFPLFFLLPSLPLPHQNHPLPLLPLVPSAKTPLTRSILPTALSNFSNLFTFSPSLFSSISTLSSNFALALLSVATISLACSNKLALSSSTSRLVSLRRPSASWRRACSRERALRRSVVVREVEAGGDRGREAEEWW